MIPQQPADGRAALDATPNDVRLLTGLGEAQLKSGDRDAARATIERGLTLDPEHAGLRALARRVK
jgi:predicted TPR repeat methyltransferase